MLALKKLVHQCEDELDLLRQQLKLALLPCSPWRLGHHGIQHLFHPCLGEFAISFSGTAASQFERDLLEICPACHSRMR